MSEEPDKNVSIGGPAHYFFTNAVDDADDELANLLDFRKYLPLPYE